jgi:hypothetical protein
MQEVMMKKVGYLEGTNSTYLTRLALRGVDTLPLGNGADNHGKYIGFIDKSDAIDLVITYYHKVVPLTEQRTSPQSLLQACQLNNVPVLVIVPKDLQDIASEAMKSVTANIRLVDPEKVMDEAREILGI